FVLVLDDPSDPGSARPVRAEDLGQDGLLKPDKASRPVTPGDLSVAFGDPKYYGNYVGRYGAAGVKAPPEPTTTVSKGLTGTKDDNNHLAVADNLTIPTGYQAASVDVQGAFTMYEQEDGDEQMWVFVGKQRFQCKGKGNLQAAAAVLPDPVAAV